MAEMLLERFGSCAFDRAKFTTVANEPFWVKPHGGMWASPVGRPDLPQAVPRRVRGVQPEAPGEP